MNFERTGEVYTEDLFQTSCTMRYSGCACEGWTHQPVYPFILVPPGPPVIVDVRGRPINQYDLGPFEVGDDIEIICQVKGGKFTYLYSTLITR